jgi:hypothetical protein
VTVSTLELVLCHFVLQLVASWDILLFSPGSPATSTGFQQTLALVLIKHNSGDEDSNSQTYANFENLSFLMASKLKHLKHWKCNTDIFFT